MTREAVARLYRSSRTLVSTSLYEGFHMPVAEAYLRGVNVVLPDAPFYRSTYSSEAGVHWYRGRDQLADTILEGVRSGAFRIDSGFAQRHSYRTVGRALVGTYEEVMRA